MTINVFVELDEIEIWLDPDENPRTGLCIGSGKSKRFALKDARLALQAVVEEIKLQEGP